MNIGIVCYPTYGGSGVIATELGKYLAAKGHHIHFISYDQPARLEFFSENLFYHEVIVSNYPLFQYPPYEIALTGRIIDVAKCYHLDLLHVHYAIPHASAGVMAAQILATEGIHLPVVTTLHGTDITLVGQDATFGPVICYALDMSDAVTSVSKSLKEDTIKTFGTGEDIHVIPNFIDFNRFKKHPREHFKKAIAPNQERIIVHTSNFRKVKRVEDVIGIFNLVQKEINAKLLLVGDGPERYAMEEIVRNLGLRELVLFLGKQEAVEEILSVSDLFLLTSEFESFGLAALEAMACEVPVISSNTGGIPEVNVDGVTGYTLNVGDIDGMARKAIEILKDDETLAGFKQAAFRHALEFDIQRIAPLYEKCYADAIEQNRAKA